MKPVFPVPEYRRAKREHRIDHRPEAPYGENVAVLVSFAGHNYVVNNGTKKESMREARQFAHILMELWDATNPNAVFPVHVTLEPLTADRAASINRSIHAFDAPQDDDDRVLIVQTCYEVIRNCPTAHVRVEAARLLQRVGHIPQPTKRKLQ